MGSMMPGMRPGMMMAGYPMPVMGYGGMLPPQMMGIHMGNPSAMMGHTSGMMSHHPGMMPPAMSMMMGRPTSSGPYRPPPPPLGAMNTASMPPGGGYRPPLPQPREVDGWGRGYGGMHGRGRHDAWSHGSGPRGVPSGGESAWPRSSKRDDRPDILSMSYEEYVESFKKLKNEGKNVGPEEGDVQKDLGAQQEQEGHIAGQQQDVHLMTEEEYIQYCQKYTAQMGMPFNDEMVRRHYRSLKEAFEAQAQGGADVSPVAVG